MREAVIVNNILKYLNGLPHCVAEKLQGSANSSGKADINACYKGRCLRIEVKTPDHGNRASKRQVANLKRWEVAGAVCMVAYSLDEVKEVVAKLEETNVFNHTRPED